MGVDFTVIRALVKRDLRLYFSNPTGYVFITIFIFLSAAAAFWQQRFFLDNLANLDQLNEVFPYLLLVFVPAITMGVWADERKQGTDELLLTLPATDFEVVLGKYLSTLGIFTGAVVLSLSHLVVLFWLGKPDLGLMLGNYLGYWLLGAAFIAVGMLASLLSTNVTVAFIIGAIFCAFFVYVEPIFGVFGEAAQQAGAPLSVFPHFADFARGVVSLSGVIYFASIAGVFLYLNVVLLGRRHWRPAPGETGPRGMWTHQAVRIVALVVALASLNVLTGRGGARLDVTAENLHSLSHQTRELIGDISSDRPVFIQAYISPDVPKEYVQTRSNLVGFLHELDAIGGDRIQLILNDTEPFSEEAREAREKFGIVPMEIQDVEGASASVAKVFMGVAFTCGAEEDVITFFDKGLPTEYELARSIRVVARTQRKRIAVLNTQVRIFGGFDFNSFASTPGWPVVDELKKQYEVEQIAATDSIAERYDGLIVALPSSLPQEEMDNLQQYIQTGVPTLLLLDPLPVFDIGLSPSEEAGANINPFMRNRGPQPKPKGSIGIFLNTLGLQWNKAQVVWDAYNPHPSLSGLQPEVMFIGRGNQNPRSFNDDYPASSGLQELVFLFAGSLSPPVDTPYQFEPLINTSVRSGALPYGQLVNRSFFGVGLAQVRQPHFATPNDYTVAAHVYGQGTADDDTSRVNVIAIADLDFIGDQFFEIRKRGIENYNFDNVSFILNCMDVLVGDESFVELRKRRVKHRTLTTVEARTRAFSEQRAAEEQEARAEAQKALSDAQARLDQRVAEVRNRTDIDEQAKQIMTRNLQEVEQRRFEAMKASIEAERDLKIQEAQEVMESQVRSIQGNIKTLAGLIPPIPVFAMGIMIFVRRRRREKEGAAAARRLKS
jgi:ABC-2 type transport system permease protein